MSKKLYVNFVAHNEPINSDIAKAQLIKLMVTVARIGMRIDSPEIKSDVIIKKENNNGNQ